MRNKVLITLLLLAGISLVLLGFYGVAKKNEKDKEKDNLVDEKEMEERKTEQEETSSDPKSVISVQPGSEIEQLINDIDNSEKLADYLNEFNIKPLNGWLAQKPDALVEKREGSPADIMVLFALILDYHNYEVGIIRYNYQKGDDIGSQVLTVFREGDQPKYMMVVDDIVEVFQYGGPFDELFLKEESRINAEISEYAVFYLGILDLNPFSWNKR